MIEQVIADRKDLSSTSRSAAPDDAVRAVIHPVPEGVFRPRWSIMIPTFHCAHYLRETLSHVLAQDMGPDLMQIEVVDDHSSNDDPESVVREVGQGRVSFFRQPQNVGHSRNFTTCLQRATGHFVHLLHGDDFVLDGFYRTLEQPLLSDARIGAAFSRFIAVDERSRWLVVSSLLAPESGILSGWLERLAEGQLLQPPSIVVRRSVYERLGGFDSRIKTYGEDWEMWVRIAASYPVWYQTDALAAYRMQTASLSGRAIRTGQNLRDLALAIETNAHLLPPERAGRISRVARQNNALGAIRRAGRFLRAGDDARTGLVQLREALRMSPTPAVFYRGSRLLLQCAAVVARRALGRSRA